jgi:hypothetical protein
MEDSKTLFCCSKFPSVRERISSKCKDNSGTNPRKKFAICGIVYILRQDHVLMVEFKSAALVSSSVSDIRTTQFNVHMSVSFVASDDSGQ